MNQLSRFLPEECPTVALGTTFHERRRLTKAIWTAVHTGCEQTAQLILLMEPGARIASIGNVNTSKVALEEASNLLRSNQEVRTGWLDEHPDHESSSDRPDT